MTVKTSQAGVHNYSPLLTVREGTMLNSYTVNVSDTTDGCVVYRCKRTLGLLLQEVYALPRCLNSHPRWPGEGGRITLMYAASLSE